MDRSMDTWFILGSDLCCTFRSPVELHPQGFGSCLMGRPNVELCWAMRFFGCGEGGRKLTFLSRQTQNNRDLEKERLWFLMVFKCFGLAFCCFVVFHVFLE